MYARLTAIIALGATVTLIAGCGGGDDAPIEPISQTTTEEQGEPSALSKSQFIAQADARCAEANVAIAGLATGASAENLELLATQEQQITAGVLESIQGLGAPSDPSGVLDQYLEALSEQVSINRRRARAAASGDTATYDQLSAELAQAKADARAAAEEYGFESCGQEGSAVAPSGSEPDEGTPAPAPAPAPEPAPAPAPAPTPPSGGTGSGGGTGGGGTGGGDGGSSGGVSPG